MLLLEQVQGTAALLLLYSGVVLWQWESELDNHVATLAAYTLLFTILTSAAVFFVTTMARIWIG